MKKWLVLLGILCSAIGLLVLGVWFFVATAPQFGQSPEGEHVQILEQSPQYGDEQFRNVNAASPQMGFVETLNFFYEWIAGAAARSPRGELPARKLKPADLEVLSDKVMLTWFGHSAFLLQTEGLNILLDPMLGAAASPVSFMNRRFDYALPLSLDELPAIDVVVISHDHYDHLDYESIVALKEKTAVFFVPLGLGAHLLHWGVEKQQIVELDWWQSARHADVEFTATPAQHFSGRSLDDANKTLWASWVIKSERAQIFFSGDSGYFDGFKEIGKRLGPFDLTLMECGQYNKKWAKIHMMPEQTVQAHIDLRGEVLMPIHWGGFDLALHPWSEPPQRLLKAAKGLSVDVALPLIGERFDVLRERPLHRWWLGEGEGVYAEGKLQVFNAF